MSTLDDLQEGVLDAFLHMLQNYSDNSTVDFPEVLEENDDSRTILVKVVFVDPLSGFEHNSFIKFFLDKDDGDFVSYKNDVLSEVNESNMWAAMFFNKQDSQASKDRIDYLEKLFNHMSDSGNDGFIIKEGWE